MAEELARVKSRTMDDEGKKVVIAAPGEWVLQKAFGPVLGEMGEDLKRLYAAGRDRILSAAVKKIDDIEDGKRPNLRVTRDALWNGSFADNEICAEYFGGIMASSRSEDGKDDSAIQFIDVTKGLSSKQLWLHYVIYNRLNKLLVSSDTRVNVGMSSELRSKQVYFATLELSGRLGLTVDTDLNILYRHGLLWEYATREEVVADEALPYTMAKPTTFGVLLYASAHNRYDEWRDFDHVDFGDFDGIQLPEYYCESLADLIERTGLANPTHTEQRESTGQNVEEKSEEST